MSPETASPGMPETPAGTFLFAHGKPTEKFQSQTRELLTDKIAQAEKMYGVESVYGGGVEGEGENVHAYPGRLKEKASGIGGGYTSHLHKDVSRVLGMMRIEHLNGLKAGPFILDAFHPETSTIIEVNPPFQFYANTQHYTALSKRRHELLRAMGFTLVHIPHQSWNRMADDDQKIQYLKSHLPRRMLDMHTHK
eukprot:GDKI01003532.1.p1 GENE.GDKI01003532.1~~GDKI01003532.1.p1  ORF type:complete len:194 (+),score=36.59 GDKI01003532.1:3-584(+)